MAKTPEKRVKDACLEVIKIYNAYHFFPVTGGYGRSGVPDIIVCYRGRFLAVECKAGYNKPTLLQEKEMAAIRKAGGDTLVVREDTVDLLVDWFKEMQHENR